MARLSRKRINGRLEDRTIFLKRKHFVKDTALCKRVTKYRGPYCELCGATTNLHCHHIDGNRKNDCEENIQTLCGSCHASHHHHARRVGRMVAGKLDSRESATGKRIESTDCGG